MNPAKLPLASVVAPTDGISPSPLTRPALPTPRVTVSPVRQTLLIVSILLLGLVAGLAILRTSKSPAGGGEHEEKSGAGELPGKVEAKAHDAHDHAEHGHAEKGRVELTPEKLKNAHLGLETAESVKMHVNLRVFGKVGPNEEQLAHVSPRFAGIAKKVNKRLGERVTAGEVLAVVEGNESLQSYDVKAPLTGTIIERGVAVGEFVGTDRSLFTVADLSTVWVDFQIYPQDFAKLRPGQRVRFIPDSRPPAPSVAAPTPPTLGEGTTGGGSGGEIAYLSPIGAENTQTMLARAHVPNATGTLRPGLFVTGEVAVDELDAPVAVRETAVQTVDGKDVVFVEEDGGFEARAVELGHRDGEWAEIRSGVRPGERYVAANSFLLKAEIGKEGAAHEH